CHLSGRGGRARWLGAGGNTHVGPAPGCVVDACGEGPAPAARFQSGLDRGVRVCARRLGSMTLFVRGSRALVGMIHLPPLPGSTSYMGQPFDQIVEQAVRDARALHAAGFRAGIIQNTHDLPVCATAPPETVACLAVVGWELRRRL